MADSKSAMLESALSKGNIPSMLGNPFIILKIMKTLFAAICAAGLAFGAALQPHMSTSQAADKASGQYSSIAAEQSFHQSGDMTKIVEATDLVSDIEAGKSVEQLVRSTGCSSGCSTGCSSGCSTGCSSGCSSGCRRW